MKVTFSDFNPNTPIKERYEYIVDYISHDFDLEFEEAFYLIKQLKHNRSSVIIYGHAVADFLIYDDALDVQIDGAGLWYAQNIDFETAEEILKATYEGLEYFGQYLPGTSREWDTWTP
ncbi:MAG TPA: hypothetical protein VGD31_09020 [Sphingobacteriaceae bacterium]